MRFRVAPRGRFGGGWWRALLAAGAASLLAACAPDYNWREIRSAEQGWVVMLPGKPATMTRRIRLDGLDVSMTMHGARVGDTSFTVAVAALPDAEPATRARAVAAMRAGMVRNIAGTEREARPAPLPVVDEAGKAVGTEAAVRVDATGTAQGKPQQLLAGFGARGARAYQWVVLGPSVDREQARTFLESFRLLAAPG
jgi:hypothetical protein